MNYLNEDELSVIAEIARMYYIEGISQQEIGNMLFFSKAKVSRALKLAREQNIVEFRIKYPLKRATFLETELKRKFNLQDVLIVEDLYDNQDSDMAIKRIGEMSAKYLDQILEDGDCVGLSWGRTLRQVVKHLNIVYPRKIQVVQLLGGSADEYNEECNGPTLVLEMAKAFHGTHFPLYAPMYIKNDIVRRELMKEPMIQKALERVRCVDYIIMGIADVSLPENLNSWAGYLTKRKREELIHNGAVGYMCGYIFDKNGQKLHDVLNESIIGISFEEIKKVPHVIAIAGGVDKTKAIFAALQGGFINCLITDSRIAEKLVAMKK